MAIKLPRLYPGLIDKQPELFERYWDEAMNSIETTLNAILAIPAIEAALVDLDVATQAALDAADIANAAAESTTAEQSIVTSFPTGFTPPLISADDTGLVTIANHIRRYGDPVLNPDVNITGGSFASGGASGDIIRVYYDDATRGDTTPTFLFTTDPTPPPVQGGSRHSVGAVEIPVSGTQDGEGVNPPGYVVVN